MKTRIIRTCPNCRSEDIFLNAGASTGKYECKNCGYIGAIVIEREIDETKAAKQIRSKGNK